MRYPFYIIAFLFLATTHSIHAQVPGYMGKKIHLQGGIKFFPSFIYPVNVQQAFPVPTVVPGMNYRLELGMDFMISRKSSIGFNTHYYNTATVAYSPYVPIKPNYDNRLGLEGGSIGAVFKTHFGGWVAPLGFYYRLEAGAMIFSIYDPANNFGGTFPNTTSGTGYINNAIGRTHVFANRITLDYGFELGFAFPPYDYYTPQGMANIRMAIQNAANFYIKLGGVF